MKTMAAGSLTEQIGAWKAEVRAWEDATGFESPEAYSASIEIEQKEADPRIQSIAKMMANRISVMEAGIAGGAEPVNLLTRFVHTLQGMGASMGNPRQMRDHITDACVLLLFLGDTQQIFSEEESVEQSPEDARIELLNEMFSGGGERIQSYAFKLLEAAEARYMNGKWGGVGLEVNSLRHDLRMFINQNLHNSATPGDYQVVAEDSILQIQWRKTGAVASWRWGVDLDDPGVVDYNKHCGERFKLALRAGGIHDVNHAAEVMASTPSEALKEVISAAEDGRRRLTSGLQKIYAQRCGVDIEWLNGGPLPPGNSQLEELLEEMDEVKSRMFREPLELPRFAGVR